MIPFLYQFVYTIQMEGANYANKNGVSEDSPEETAIHREVDHFSIGEKVFVANLFVDQVIIISGLFVVIRRRLSLQHLQRL